MTELREPPDAPPVGPSVWDAMGWPGESAAWLASAPAGPDAIAALCAIDRAALTEGGRIDYLVAVRRQQAFLASLEQRVLGDLAVEPDPDGRSWVAEQVAAACQVASDTAAARLHTARRLMVALPAVLAAVETGRITFWHAQVLVDETADLPERSAAAIAERLLDRAERSTLGQLRRLTRRAVAQADPRTVEQKHRDAFAERRVCVTPQGNGMSELWALLPADAAATVMRAVGLMADRDRDVPDAHGNARTADQRRADALGDLAAAALADDTLPRRQGQRPAIQVTVSLRTLLGLSDEPADLDGDPIPASMARRLAADPTGTWRRLITDGRGRLLDYGRRTYKPPADLRDLVVNRDRTCRFPGCTRPARRADLDHHRDWALGGTTSQHNLGALCERHHQLKHEAGWRIRIGADGETIWTSPTGHRYVRDAETYPGPDPPR